ncbi:MAG: sulfatase-like hydrolase/transferase [Ginsengibacter sp.]
MVKSFQKQPFYLLLIPLFFVLHGFAENFGFISFGDVLILAATYVVATIVVYLLFFFFFRDRVKAALAASFLIAFYLFFGAIQDFFNTHALILSRYSVLLLLFVIVFIALAFCLKKTKNNFSKLNLFLNSLFFIYIIIDLGSLVYKNFNPPVNKLSVYPFAKKNNYQPCGDCAKPDIYFLLFDEYASSESLKNHFNYDNSSLDTFLIQQGFHIQLNSTSNYDITPFSIASMLNMSYLNGVNGGAVSIEDYARCNELIRNNEVIKFLSLQGYHIVNYSIFDLAGNPSLTSQSFLPLKTKLISDATLFNRMQKDLLWNFNVGRFKIKWLAHRLMYANENSNNMFMNLVKKAPSDSNKIPRFIYAHFFLPHLPYYYTKDGVLRDEATLLKEWNRKIAPSYLDYVTYTNTKIKELISAIKANTKGEAVIIFMGDHGFRKFTGDGDSTHFFQNQNAVYFPSRDYHLLYDSVSAVNQFGIVFNTLFHQNFPILNDSTVFLTDKK